MAFSSNCIVHKLFGENRRGCRIAIMLVTFLLTASVEAFAEAQDAISEGDGTPSVNQENALVDDAGAGCPADNLFRYWQYIDGATEQDTAIKTEMLARTLMPDFMADYESELPERGWWCLQCITEDLDGDQNAEHLLLFWHEHKCDSAFCVVQGPSVIQGDTLQGWSYSPPTMTIVTNKQAGKLIICSRTTTSHCTGLFEKKYTVYRMNNGRIDKVFEVPEVFRCCWLDMNTVLSPSDNGNIHLCINYSYREGNDCYGDPIVEGEMEAYLEWDEEKGIFEPSFDAGDSSPEAKKFQFLIDQRPPWDAEFEAVWTTGLEKYQTSDVPALSTNAH